MPRGKFRIPFMERGRRETGTYLYEQVYMYTYAYVDTQHTLHAFTCVYLFFKK